MARKKIQTPCPGRLKSGGQVTVLREIVVGGVPCVTVKDTDGEQRDYARDRVIVSKPDG